VPISNAVGNGTTVRVYDENGILVFAKPGKVRGFTRATVSITNDGATITYDASGRFKSIDRC
jgi:hypothetical protein